MKYPYYRKSLHKVIRKFFPIEKWEKDIDRHFAKNNNKMVNKNIKDVQPC